MTLGGPGLPSEPPQIVQKVTAVNGFAYGVVGADIHVFDNGLPLYLLANWHTQRTGDSDWLRELPSRMLNARRSVVTFTGRDNELTDLRHWRDDGPQLAVRWLHAPGGQGKTRLAAQFACESAAAGWKVIAAFHGPDADQPEPGSQDMSLEGGAGLLLIVDYADRWLLTNLTWLFKNALLHKTAVATRILMLARTANAWPRIRGILDTYQAGTSSQPLTPLSPEAGERTEMFTVARDSFAAHYDLSDPSGIDPPGPLDAAEFGLTLAVHMAALVAVDAHVMGRRRPHDMAGLTIYLLDREHLHWARLYGGAREPGPSGSTYLTPPEMMNHAVFAAALTGPLARPAGTAVLEKLGLQQPDQIISDHVVCYPPSTSLTVLEPLYPDRLAEDFLALTIPGHPADYPGQPWAAPTATALLERHGDQRTPAAWTRRTITMLAAAAENWPHLGPNYLYPLLLDDPQLAVHSGSAALTTLANLPNLNHAVLEAIEGHLPKHRHVDLDTGIAALAARLAEYRLTGTNDLAERAGIYNSLGFRLFNAELYDQALAAAEQEVQAYQRLADANAAANPYAFAPDLAVALTNLGTSLSNLGRWEEALTSAQVAVQVLQQLAAADEVRFRPDLAGSLSSLGTLLGKLGRREEALAATDQATRMYRLLAKVWPVRFEHELAGSLNNLVNRLSDLGRQEEALPHAEQAVKVHQRLAAADEVRFEPGLAGSLSRLGALLWELGRWAEALTPADQAVQIHRRLATSNPAAFEPGLAFSLSNLGTLLGKLGGWEEALAAAAESVKIRRRLAEANPTAFEPDLAFSLTNLGAWLLDLGRQEEALPHAEQAVQVYRRLAKANPAKFEPDLARSVAGLGVALGRVGRWEEALAATAKSVKIRRRLAEANPAKFEPDLAAALGMFAAVRVETNRELAEAREAVREAIAIYERLAGNRPAAFEDQMETTTRAVAASLDRLGRTQEAAEPGSTLAGSESRSGIRGKWRTWMGTHLSSRNGPSVK